MIYFFLYYFIITRLIGLILVLLNETFLKETAITYKDFFILVLPPFILEVTLIQLLIIEWVKTFFHVFDKFKISKHWL